MRLLLPLALALTFLGNSARAQTAPVLPEPIVQKIAAVEIEGLRRVGLCRARE